MYDNDNEQQRNENAEHSKLPSPEQKQLKNQFSSN